MNVRAICRQVGIAVALASTVIGARAGNLQHIEYYGDSTIWGYVSGGGGRVATPEPAAFADALAPLRRFTVANEGVNGTTACQLLEGHDGRHPPWDQQMARSNADVVIVDFGINDEWAYDLQHYTHCLTELVRGARHYHKHVILETPNPTRDSGPEGLDTYVDAMRSVANSEGVPLIDQYRMLSSYLAGASPYSICPDGLHPAPGIYVMKGRFAAREFLRMYGGH